MGDTIPPLYSAGMTFTYDFSRPLKGHRYRGPSRVVRKQYMTAQVPRSYAVAQVRGRFEQTRLGGIYVCLGAEDVHHLGLRHIRRQRILSSKKSQQSRHCLLNQRHTLS